MGSTYDSIELTGVECPRCKNTFDDEDVQFTVIMGKYKSSCWHDRVKLGAAMPSGFPKCRFEAHGMARCDACGRDGSVGLAVLFEDGRPTSFRPWPEGGEGVVRPPRPRKTQKRERRKAAKKEATRRLNAELRAKLGDAPSGWDLLGSVMVEAIRDQLMQPSPLRRLLRVRSLDAKPDVGPYEHVEGHWRRRLDTGGTAR